MKKAHALEYDVTGLNKWAKWDKSKKGLSAS